jgi:hypothetical protein
VRCGTEAAPLPLPHFFSFLLPYLRDQARSFGASTAPQDRLVIVGVKVETGDAVSARTTLTPTIAWSWGAARSDAATR